MWGLNVGTRGLSDGGTESLSPSGLPAMQQQLVPPPKMEAACVNAGEGAEDQSFPKFITV